MDWGWWTQKVEDIILSWTGSLVLDWLRASAAGAVLTAAGWLMARYREWSWQRELKGAMIGFIAMTIVLALVHRGPTGTSAIPLQTANPAHVAEAEAPTPSPTPHVLNFDQTVALTAAFTRAGNEGLGVLYQWREIWEEQRNNEWLKTGKPGQFLRMPLLPPPQYFCTISSSPQNRDFADLISRISTSAGYPCQPAVVPTPDVTDADATPLPTPTYDNFITIRASSSDPSMDFANMDLNRIAADHAADILAKAFRIPPMTLDARRSKHLKPNQTNTGSVIIELNNVSPWP
jgi:hypothetical protein